MIFPDGKKFAFTILDDTDDTTLLNGRPIYSLLDELDIRITKTVWALDTPPEEQGPYFAAETLQSPQYLEWVHELADQGFEIAFHNASMGSSIRERTIEALDLLSREFNQSPILHCNHGQNKENLYWGTNRYSNILFSGFARMYSIFAKNPVFEGHIENSPYFWGDIALKNISYVRAFAFNRLDCGKIPPGVPFHDPRKPYVRRWFNTADVPDAQGFKKIITRESINSLYESRSWCILSTHLGKGYCSDGVVDPEIEATFRYIATLPGWYVPVSVLLDYLTRSEPDHTLSCFERLRLESTHILDRILSHL